MMCDVTSEFSKRFPSGVNATLAAAPSTVLLASHGMDQMSILLETKFKAGLGRINSKAASCQRTNSKWGVAEGTGKHLWVKCRNSEPEGAGTGLQSPGSLSLSLSLSPLLSLSFSVFYIYTQTFIPHTTLYVL
jgi:hypothetical protein